MNYAVRVHAEVTAKHERTGQGPLSHTALFTLHRSAITTYRSICSICEAGWTPISPILTRTLLDILVNAYAVVSKDEDAEYMGFKYMCSYLILAVKDPDISEDRRAFENQQLTKMRAELRGPDIKRVDDLITNYKPPSYWYQPEFSSPGSIIKKVMPRYSYMYRQFSGSTHGGFIGGLLFNDTPDSASIDPQENPAGTRNAVVASSRLLLDISWARGQFHGVTDETEYKHMVRTFIAPQKAKVENRDLGSILD